MANAAAISCALLGTVASIAAPPDPALGSAAGAGGSQSPQPQPRSANDEDPLQTFRAPLLREGSTLVEAHARLRRDSGAGNWWTVVIEPDASEIAISADVPGGATGAAPPHELIVLPCTRLAEMQRIMDATPGGNARFQVSGRVYVFRDRNYFLPTHAAVISAARPSPLPPAIPTSNPTEGQAQVNASRPATPPTTAATIPGGDDSAEAIARSLEQAAGPLARSSAAARNDDTVTPPDQPNSAVAARAADRGGTLQENTPIVNRRGKITRDRSGGWMLVFDSSVNTLTDPPLRILPCMLLESIEDYARRVGNNSPIIITGQVYLYNGQNHLLPTVYRIPKESSRLTP